MPAMKPPVLDEDLPGSRASQDHTGNIDAGYVALQRLWVARGTQVIPRQLHSHTAQKFKIRMVSRQRKHKIILDLQRASRSFDSHAEWHDLHHRAAKVHR